MILHGLCRLCWIYGCRRVCVHIISLSKYRAFVPLWILDLTSLFTFTSFALFTAKKMNHLKVFMSLLLLIIFLILFGFKNINRFMQDGVSISQYQISPQKIKAPGILFLHMLYKSNIHRSRTSKILLTLDSVFFFLKELSCRLRLTVEWKKYQKSVLVKSLIRKRRTAWTAIWYPS